MTRSIAPSNPWKLLIGLALVAGCGATDVHNPQASAEDRSIQNSNDPPELYFVHSLTEDPAEIPAETAAETEPASSEQSPSTADESISKAGPSDGEVSAAGNEPGPEGTDGEVSAAEQAFQDALDAFRAASQALAAGDDAKANLALRRAVELLQSARSESARESRPKDCCSLYKPENCPPIKPCSAAGDACVIVQLPAIDGCRTSYSYEGTYAFSALFSAAVARGVENATIRAMNATKVCPLPPCDPPQQQHRREEGTD